MNKKEKLLVGLMIGICILIILDVNLTIMGIAKFGIEAEGNPVVKNLILNGDIHTWFLIKIIGFLMLFFGIFYYIKKVEKIKLRNFCDVFMLCIFIPTFIFCLLVNIDWIIHLLELR